MTIEQSRAAAIAAFRAGRRAGLLDAIRIIVDLMDEKTTMAERQPFMDACEAIQQFAPDILDTVTE